MVSKVFLLKLKDLCYKKNWGGHNLIKKMKNDKKVISNQLRFILCKGIGKTFISREVTNEKLLQTINLFT